MRQTAPADLNLSPCLHCGNPLGDNTITDQRGVWHEPCYVEVNQPQYETSPAPTALSVAAGKLEA